MHLANTHMLDNQKPSSADSSKSKTAYLVITSDRGMVGSYNSNAIRGTNRFINILEQSRLFNPCSWG